VGDPLRSCQRRPATFGDRAWIAAIGAAILCIWFRLPLFIDEMSWTHDSNVGLAVRFSALGEQASWVVEWALYSAALFGFQAALGRFGVSRLRLSRPLLGAVGAVVVLSVCASTAAGLGLRELFVPIGLGALWISASFGLGAGLVGVLCSVALCAVSGAAEILSVALLVRAVAVILLFRDGEKVADGLRAGILAGVLAGAVDASMSLGTGKTWLDLASIAGWQFLGGLSEGAIYLLTRGLGERLLGHVSRERLVALLDLSQPLLQRMVQRAPGSFEHSRAMANLAEQAASSIGADALLTRVGAYYHDLGKSIEPKFFVENLDPGEISAHEGLSPKESTRHILRHVSQGVEILRSGGIPEPVVEFAYTHHGNQLVEYFLNKERKLREVDGGPVDVESFRYPGMKPGTKETAILMVVDSIEAASRTLDSPERAPIEDMVRRIVFSKLAGGHLDESGLTLKELRVVCSRVVETLVHMNHHRIKYPWQEERARQFGVEKGELSPLSRYPRAVAGGM
jgi:cyclic-di-AMP phosphodiesterase PgpH